MMEVTASELKLLAKNFPIKPNMLTKVGEEFDLELNDEEQEFGLLEDVGVEESHELPSDLVESCCSRGCLSTLNPSALESRRNEFRQMQRNEREAAVLSLLGIGIKQNAFRNRFTFFFDMDTPVCKRAFCVVYGISERQLGRLQAISAKHVFAPPKHGNIDREPAHAIPEQTIKEVRHFIRMFAEIYGLAAPSGITSTKSGQLLPSMYSMKRVWDEYRTSKKSAREASIGYRSFVRIWNDGCQDIRIQGAKTDVCDRCTELRKKIAFSRNEKEIEDATDEMQEHITAYSAARGWYNSEIARTLASWQKVPSSIQNLITSRMINSSRAPMKVAQNSVDVDMHYSFDYAQKISFPHSPQQQGKIYFLTPRRCELFGVCSEPLSRQVMYMIDEVESIGKGAVSIITYLDAFFASKGVGEKRVSLHADNCTGQNKNRFLLFYLAWRTMVGLHTKISFSFMVPGHTKFRPDAYFGLFKIAYRKWKADWLKDAIACAKAATQGDKLIPEYYGKVLGLKENRFEYRAWDSFLDRYFVSLDGIRSYNYFEFSSDKPGIVFYSKAPGDALKQFDLRKNVRWIPDQTNIVRPKIIKPIPTDPDRLAYLKKKISPLATNPANRKHLSYTISVKKKLQN